MRREHHRLVAASKAPQDDLTNAINTSRTSLHSSAAKSLPLLLLIVVL
jgi:hypothetical protein